MRPLSPACPPAVEHPAAGPSTPSVACVVRIVATASSRHVPFITAKYKTFKWVPSSHIGQQVRRDGFFPRDVHRAAANRESPLGKKLNRRRIDGVLDVENAPGERFLVIVGRDDHRNLQGGTAVVSFL